MRMIVALCLILLVTAINGGAMTLAQSLGEGAGASGAIAVELSSSQTVLENCCGDEATKILPRSLAPCAADCNALIPTVAPTLALNEAQGDWVGSYALTEGPGQTWQRPPRA